MKSIVVSRSWQIVAALLALIAAVVAIGLSAPDQAPAQPLADYDTSPG